MNTFTPPAGRSPQAFQQAPKPWAPPTAPTGTKPYPNVTQPNSLGAMQGITAGTGTSGYVGGPNGAVRAVTPGQPVTLKPGEFYSTDAMPGTQTKSGQLQQAAIGDRNASIAAQDRAKGRFDQAISGFQSDIDRGLGQADQLAGQMQGQMKKDAGNFDEAKQFFRDSVSGYQDRSAKDMAALSAGIDSQMNQAISDIQNNQDIPDYAKDSEINKVKMQFGAQKQQAATQAYSNANNALASLRQSAGQGLTDIGRSQAATNQTYLGMIDATKARANQMAMQGRQAMATLLTNYPDSAFSMVDTLLQMNQFDTMKNGNQSGFKFS